MARIPKFRPKKPSTKQAFAASALADMAQMGARTQTPGIALAGDTGPGTPKLLQPKRQRVRATLNY